ncbi:uncharacterized protein [Malus domestica]|uniref:uncharacterized protein n=1 Tax=Malus domestica TaxID=3750 RepID=UPI003976B1EE
MLNRAYRTAICKAKRGGFKDTLPDDLLAPVLNEVIERTNLNPSEVGDIVVGTVRAPGSLRATECRMAAFYAGFPDCIGSAFNIKGAMQCPNCRKIKKGQWLYSNGCCSFPELNMEDWTHDEDLYDLSYSEMIMAAALSEGYSFFGFRGEETFETKEIHIRCVNGK